MDVVHKGEEEEANEVAKLLNECVVVSVASALAEQEQHGPSVLVSAMKGGREKHGGASSSSPRKLTLSWAPDVYDPLPTSASHTVNPDTAANNGQRKNHHHKSNNSKNTKKKHSKHSHNHSRKVSKKPTSHESSWDFILQQPTC